MAVEPDFVKDTTAAKLLELPVGRFREYVEKGILPGPVIIGRDERWDRETIKKVLRGELVHEEKASW